MESLFSVVESISKKGEQCGSENCWRVAEEIRVCAAVTIHRGAERERSARVTPELAESPGLEIDGVSRAAHDLFLTSLSEILVTFEAIRKDSRIRA